MNHTSYTAYSRDCQLKIIIQQNCNQITVNKYKLYLSYKLQNATDMKNTNVFKLRNAVSFIT